MEPMPEYKEGFITLRRNDAWIQIPLTDLPKVMEEDNKSPELTEVPNGA